MATVNQQSGIENVLTPDEIGWFNTNAPHFLEYMRIQQTLISQLIIRVGGSGPGTNIPDLDELADDVEAIASDVAEIGEQVTATDSSAHVEEVRSIAEQALIVASSGNSASELLPRVEMLESLAIEPTLIAQISELRQRIEALENVSNA